jgi:signal transduction histidine kinase
MKRLIVTLFLVGGIMFTGRAMADPLTPQICRDKTIAAAKLIETEGTASAFDKIKDPAGDFFFGDGNGYVFVVDSYNMIVLHPKKPELVGKNMADFKDVNGKAFFIDMTDLVTEKGSGWIFYEWPKPGKKENSPKAAYGVKAASGGKVYIVCSGVYDVTKEDIKKQFPGDPMGE